MLVDFLKTNRSKEDLKIVLDTLKEFKQCESYEEWMWSPFSTWVKLEQMEEFLEYLVNGEELANDTKREIARLKNLNTKE